MLTLTEVANIAGITKSAAIRMAEREDWKKSKRVVGHKLHRVFDVDAQTVTDARRRSQERQRDNLQYLHQKNRGDADMEMKKIFDQLFMLIDVWIIHD